MEYSLADSPLEATEKGSSIFQAFTYISLRVLDMTNIIYKWKIEERVLVQPLLISFAISY